MNDIKRDGFTFYRSFYESVSDFEIEDQKELYRYIIEYALLDINPSIDNKFLNSIFKLIKPNIDSSIKKYDQRIANNQKRSEKAKESRSKNPKKSRTNSEHYPNKDNNTNNTNKKENAIKNDNKTSIYKDLPPILVNALEDFEDMRKQVKKPLTDKARKVIVNKLREYSNGDLDIMIEILNQSIVNCWSNVYPLKKTNNEKKKNLTPLEIAMLEVKEEKK